jgi:amino acid transporter
LQLQFCQFYQLLHYLNHLHHHDATRIAAGSAVGLTIITAGALLTTFNEGLSDLLRVSCVAFAMSRENDLRSGLLILGSGQNPRRSALFIGVIAILVTGFSPLT